MKHKLAFFTSTRSDMTILEPLLNEIKKSKSFEYLLFVHGTHLEKNYGNTIADIKKLNFKISSKFLSVNKLDNELGLVKSLEMTQKGVNKIFNKYKFDSVMILGDRIERLPIVSAALAYRKFIFHIHGGEITTGALDDQVRHMITKSAHLHFTICENYSKNILDMAEETFRIHNVGSLGVEKILNNFKKEKKDNRVILTYHPETLKNNFSWNRNFLKIVNELNKFNFDVIITSPGHEKGTKNQINFIKKIIKNKNKFSFVKSLGVNGYFETLKKSLFVIGNSSSGIIEVPYYRIPTINIGLRQNGRFFHKSIIQCNTSSFSIRKSIIIANSKIFRDKIKNMKLHFGNGGASKKILNIIKKYSKDKNKLLNKQFQN
jgi:GDP/UDP-N,N'-diacetylbacillosamine 2-epimerase (hydrolysing)